MAKLVCTALVKDDDERRLICDWLHQTDGCSYNVVGKTIMATYVKEDTPNNSDIYWGIVHMFEQYQDHSVDHH